MYKIQKGLETLLELNDTRVYFSDRFWVNFEIILVETSIHIPHGIKYSLTLHDGHRSHKNGTRILGYDNAHGIDSSKKYQARQLEWDHFHNEEQVSYYTFVDCHQLVNDFWDKVKRKLISLGVEIA